MIFKDDPITEYIISLQETGLYVNEIRKESEYIPIECYIDLLNNFIQIAEMYRDESERNEKHMLETQKVIKDIALMFGKK